MQNGSERESGERRAGRRSAIIGLVAIVAVAGTIGIVVSFGQRPPPAPPVPTPTAPAEITPSPVPTEPEVGTSFAVADDLATREVVLFGGEDDGDNTWLWSGTTWTLARPTTRPPGRFGASAAYDPATRTVLLFGGRTEDGTAVADTWSWDGTGWNELDGGSGGPEAGEGSDMAWDAAQRQMVLVIGSGGTGTGATWVWGGARWGRVPGGGLPAAWFYSPMWSDPVTGSLTAVGCCAGPPPASGAVESTWRWNGSGWRKLDTSRDAPLDGSTMALDPSLGRLVLCTCGYIEPQEPELSVWNGRDWMVMPSAHLPVQGGIEITDLDRGQLLLLGSPMLETASSPAPVQVWSLDGSSWHRLD
jgi:Galactose oxidase, central domain